MTNSETLPPSFVSWLQLYDHAQKESAGQTMYRFSVLNPKRTDYAFERVSYTEYLFTMQYLKDKAFDELRNDAFTEDEIRLLSIIPFASNQVDLPTMIQLNQKIERLRYKLRYVR